MRKSRSYHLNFSLRDIKEEVWKDIPGFSDHYQISNYGRIKALERWIERKSIKGDMLLKERIMKQTIQKRLNPYTKKYFNQLSICLCRDASKTTLTPARLVYYLFVENFTLDDPKLTVIAKDGNNLNTHYLNLKLASKSEVQVKTYKEKRKKKPFKIISQYDQNGCLIKTYSSLIEAAASTGFDETSISQTAKGNFPHLGGMLWRFGNRKKIKSVKFPYKHVKRIAQYTPKGVLVKKFFSIAEAKRLTGFNQQGISAAAKKRRATYKGFVWKYIDSDKPKLTYD